MVVLGYKSSFNFMAERANKVWAEDFRSFGRLDFLRQLVWKDSVLHVARISAHPHNSGYLLRSLSCSNSSSVALGYSHISYIT